MDNFVTTFKEKIEEFASPFMSSFIISWIIINHKYLLIIFGTQETKEKIEELSKYPFYFSLDYQYITQIWWTYSFWLPLFTALFYVYIYPMLANKFYSKTMTYKTEKEKIKYDKYSKALNEDKQKLYSQIIEKDTKINEQQKRLIEIDDLLKKENQIEKDKLIEKFAMEIEELKTSNSYNLQEVQKKSQEEMQTTNNRHNVEMESLQKRHEEEIDRIETTYKKSIQDLETINTKIKKSLERKIDNIEEEINKRESHLNTMFDMKKDSIKDIAKDATLGGSASLWNELKNKEEMIKLGIKDATLGGSVAGWNKMFKSGIKDATLGGSASLWNELKNKEEMIKSEIEDTTLANLKYKKNKF